jgi:hypothetical protein
MMNVDSSYMDGVPGLTSGELYFRSDPDGASQVLPPALSSWLASTEPGIAAYDKNSRAVHMCTSAFLLQEHVAQRHFPTCLYITLGVMGKTRCEAKLSLIGSARATARACRGSRLAMLDAAREEGAAALALVLDGLRESETCAELKTDRALERLDARLIGVTLRFLALMEAERALASRRIRAELNMAARSRRAQVEIHF